MAPTKGVWDFYSPTSSYKYPEGSDLSFSGSLPTSSPTPADRKRVDLPRVSHPMRGNDIEPVERYEEGGYYPIHLGDKLCAGRYEIVHKLGYGSYATVWLARDHHVEQYVALRINSAHASGESMSNELNALKYLKDRPGAKNTYILFPTHNFWIDSANGRHLCFATKVLGKNLWQIARTQHKTGEALTPISARRMSLQITQTVAWLHDQNVAHTDINANNVMLEINFPDHWTTKKVYELLGEPVTEEVKMVDGGLPWPQSPDYLVRSANMDEVTRDYTTGNIRLIDFGSAGYLDDYGGLTGTHGPAARYAAPESVINYVFGDAADVWGLGGVIFDLRAATLQFHTDAQTVAEEVMEKIYDPCKHGLIDVGQSLHLMIGGKIVRDGWIDESSIDTDSEEHKAEVKKILARFTRDSQTFSEKIDDPQNYIGKIIDFTNRMFAIKSIGAALRDEAVWQKVANMVVISREEAVLFDELLSQIFGSVDPEERISASAMLQHPWFSMNISRLETV